MQDEIVKKIDLCISELKTLRIIAEVGELEQWCIDQVDEVYDILIDE